MHYYLQCVHCGKTYCHSENVYQCQECGHKLQVVYRSLPKGDNVAAWQDDDRAGIWSFWKQLPISNVEQALSLGEGNTFLHESAALASLCDALSFRIKDEGTNPTGSFKDRNAALGVSRAMELGAKAIVIASDGNAGPAVAAYAAKAGLPCYVLMPTATTSLHIAQTEMYGARVLKISGKGLVSECIKITEYLRRKFNWHNLTTAGPVNPYQLEAPKTIIYEIAADLDGNMPDWIVAPAGGGGLIASMFKAMQELLEAGMINHCSRILCVQTEGCPPLVQAFREGRELRLCADPRPTVAVPTAVPFPLEGEEVLQALRLTNGNALTVSDSEILSAQSLLAKREGICASPAGAVAVAGALKACKHGIIGKHSTILAFVTATGLKDVDLGNRTPHELREYPADPHVIERELEPSLSTELRLAQVREAAHSPETA